MLLQILLLIFLSTSVYAQANGPISFQTLNGFKECVSADYSTIDQIEVFLESTYERIKSEKKVSYWELEDRKSRFPHYCIEECACLAEEFSKSLKTTYKNNLDIYGIRIHGGPGLLPVEIMHDKYKNSFQYHIANLIKIRSSNCYVIADPIMNGITLMSPTTWSSQIISIEQNKLHIWKR
jgi:hypothetical protein